VETWRMGACEGTVSVLSRQGAGLFRTTRTKPGGRRVTWGHGRVGFCHLCREAPASTWGAGHLGGWIEETAGKETVRRAQLVLPGTAADRPAERGGGAPVVQRAPPPLTILAEAAAGQGMPNGGCHVAQTRAGALVLGGGVGQLPYRRWNQRWALQGPVRSIDSILRRQLQVAQKVR
jgi:hypothetical protein